MGQRITSQKREPRIWKAELESKLLKGRKCEEDSINVGKRGTKLPAGGYKRDKGW